MNPKEKFDACMKQADFLTQKVYNRQGYQWKVTLGLWAFIAAFANFAWGKRITVSWWPFAVVWLGYGFLWLRGIWAHNHDDQIRGWHFRDQAVNILTTDTVVTSPEPGRTTYTDLRFWFGFLTNWAHLFEFLTTAVLLGGAYFILKRQ